MTEPTTLQELRALTPEEVGQHVHVVVAGGGKCLCGVYDGVSMSCRQIIAMHTPGKTSFTAEEYSPEIKRRKMAGQEIILGLCPKCGGDRLCPDPNRRFCFDCDYAEPLPPLDS